MNIPEPAPHPTPPARGSAQPRTFSESARTAHSVHPSSTFRRDETIEFTPKLGEDALIGQAPVRPRGRSSSSSINTHSISSKQQRSSSITNSPDPSIITSTSSNLCCAGRTPPVSMRPSLGGYAQSKGATGTRSNAIGARALYSPLSPPASSYTWPFIRARWLLTEKYTEGLHLGASGEGGSSLHGPISAMHRTQRAPFDGKHASKTTMIMVATIRLRRSSPRSRGPPSQSET